MVTVVMMCTLLHCKHCYSPDKGEDSLASSESNALIISPEYCITMSWS